MIIFFMNEAGVLLMSVLPTIPKARVFPTEQTEPCDLKLKGLVASPFNCA